MMVTTWELGNWQNIAPFPLYLSLPAKSNPIWFSHGDQIAFDFSMEAWDTKESIWNLQKDRGTNSLLPREKLFDPDNSFKCQQTKVI